MTAFSSPDLKAFLLHLRHYRSSGFAPSLPNPPRAVKGETESVVSVFLRSSRRPSSALRDLRPRSLSDVRRNSLRKPAPPATDSPTLASRLVGQCFYSDAGASGGKTLISRLNLYPSATCRALRACPLWDLWSVSASALQTRKPPPKHHRSKKILTPECGCCHRTASHARKVVSAA